MTPCVSDAGSLGKPRELGAMPLVRIIVSGVKSQLELLSSVPQRRSVTVRWWIRDNGSSDSTREMMTDASSHMDMHVSAGSNNRTVLSVLDLFQACAKDEDFYSFCGQDGFIVEYVGVTIACHVSPLKIMLSSALFLPLFSQFGGDGHFSLLSQWIQYLALGIITVGPPVLPRTYYA